MAVTRRPFSPCLGTTLAPRTLGSAMPDGKHAPCVSKHVMVGVVPRHRARGDSDAVAAIGRVPLCGDLMLSPSSASQLKMCCWGSLSDDPPSCALPGHRRLGTARTPWTPGECSACPRHAFLRCHRCSSSATAGLRVVPRGRAKLGDRFRYRV